MKSLQAKAVPQRANEVPSKGSISLTNLVDSGLCRPVYGALPPPLLHQGPGQIRRPMTNSWRDEAAVEIGFEQADGTLQVAIAPLSLPPPSCRGRPAGSLWAQEPRAQRKVLLILPKAAYIGRTHATYITYVYGRPPCARTARSSGAAGRPLSSNRMLG